MKSRFPKKLTPEFLYVDLLNNLDELAEDRDALRAHAIDAIEVRVLSGPGQSAGRRMRLD